MRGKKYYRSIDGLRTYSAIGIVMMHIRFNNNYSIDGVFYREVLGRFPNLVFLFMLISGFSLCCGYYEKIKENRITMADFYGRRYRKIWPFFAVLVILDVLVSFSFDGLIEAFADLTLCFGLLPNAGGITVIGVGWTLGVIFVFYMLFPFIVFLMDNKRRGWLAVITAMCMNVAANEYFFPKTFGIADIDAGTNFAYSAVFFLIGCMIYLYRDKIGEVAKFPRYIIYILTAGFTVGYFVAGGVFQ